MDKHLWILVIVLVIVWWSRRGCAKETYSGLVHGDEFAQILDIPLTRQTTPGSGLRPRTSVADAELSILKDYFQDFKGSAPKPRHQDRELLPFNTSVYGNDRLQPVQPHPIEFVLDSVSEDIPTVQDQVVSSLTGFFGMPADELRQKLMNKLGPYVQDVKVVHPFPPPPPPP